MRHQGNVQSIFPAFENVCSKPTATAARAAGADKDTNALIAFTLGYKQAVEQVNNKAADSPAAGEGLLLG